MEWITELAGELLSRGQVGKDGRTVYFRRYGRNSGKAVLEIVEQVMAKPLRSRKSQKKLSLKERWVFPTWVGTDAETNERVVVIGEAGAAIRVRTVLRRQACDRWNVDAVKAMQASLRIPSQSLRWNSSRRWACARKHHETLRTRRVARSSPQNGWTRTRVILPGQTIEAGSLLAR